MFARPSSIPYICARCLSKQRSRPYSKAAKLTNRRLIAVQGQDAPKFLQGIITNNVRPESDDGFYAAFLTAQGKVLHDTFIFPASNSNWHRQQRSNANAQDPGYLIEVDAEQAETLLKHLKRHKLRSKFQLRLLEEGELGVWSLWDEDGQTHTDNPQPGYAEDGMTIKMPDCRAPGMGIRLLLETLGSPTFEHAEETSLQEYTIRRYLRGVPEGQKEMPRDDCLPMNCNLDIMKGIDFKKGCYVGQELTIRTHHTGVVRRRILPVMLYEHGTDAPEKLEYKSTDISTSIPDDTDIRKDDRRKRSTGKLIASVGNIGLGMCRLEQMTDLVITGEGTSYSPEDRFFVYGEDDKKRGIKAFVPDWIRGSIREPRVQKRVE